MPFAMTLSQLDEIVAECEHEKRNETLVRRPNGIGPPCGTACEGPLGEPANDNGNKMTLQQLTRTHESLLLDKLQDMVPIMPRGRALSKLEVINYVIDYIRQLREMVVESQYEMRQ